MSLLKYFKRSSDLPDPNGPLSKELDPFTIRLVNERVKPEIEKSLSGKRGPYVILTPLQRALIGKRAAENGVTATIRHFSGSYDGCDLKETTVRRFKNEYLVELKKKRHCEDDEVTELPLKKRGRPLLLGEELDQKVRTYLIALRSSGAVVNTAVAVGCAKGVVASEGANILACNGGHIDITKYWAKNLLSRMGYVKRRGTTKAKVTVEDFDAVKEQYLLDIKNVIEMDEIPNELVINWDQTGIHYVPVSSWTMDKEGSKRIEIVAADDKRQLTAVFAGSMTGDFLPPQLVYKGKTQRCLPVGVRFPSDWDLTYSDNHWSNEGTMNSYIHKIILPYVAKKREELNLVPDHPALMIFDHFNGQCTENFFKLLETNHIDVILVPANCTDRLQPLDLSVNKPAKCFLRGKFEEWYSEKVCSQLSKGTETPVQPVDLRLSVVKPLGAKWMIQLFDHFKAHPDVIKNGFRAAGIIKDT